MPRAFFPRRAAGFTLLEWVIITFLAGILMAVLFDRMLRYQEFVEMTAMESTIINIQSGIRLRIAELMTLDRMDEAEKIPLQNPVNWLQNPPPNYVGAIDTLAQKNVPEGSWYFDTDRLELVYLPRMKRFIEEPSGEDKSMRFKVIAKLPATKEAGVYKHAQGLEIVKLTPYRWFSNGF